MFDPIQNTLEEMQITDLVFSQIRDYEEVGIDSNIVLINNGHLNREQFGKMLEIIGDYNPTVIGIDAFFRKPKGEELDIPLSEAFQIVDNVILASQMDNYKDGSFDTIKYSNPMFQEYVSGNGYVNLYIGSDDFKTVRLIQPKMKYKDSTVYGFPVEVAKRFNLEKADNFLRRENELEAINYKRNIDKYITLDPIEVFENQDELDYLEGKIVLIGFLGPDKLTKVTEDIFYTPLNDHYVGKAEPDMYGVVVHANTISMILDGDFITRIPEWLADFLMVFIVVVNMLLFRYYRDNKESLYQALTILTILGEMFFFTILILLMHHWFNIELRFAGAFFAFLVCILSFEIYNDSIKRLVRDRYRAIQLYRKSKKDKEIAG